MIQQEWNNKGYPVRTVWKPLDSYKDISPIWQVYGLCFTSDKKVLIIRNPLKDGSYTPWYLPGGTPENNETPKETLAREVDEEADMSLSKIKLLGAFEVFFPGNPNKKKGEHYYQLRYFAMIDELREQTIDPHSNEMVERKLIPSDEFTKYVEWGDVGKELIRVALEQFELK